MQLQHLRPAAFPILFLVGLLAATGVRGANEDVILQRLLALEENQRRLEEQLAERDARILEMEQRLGVGPGAIDQLYSVGVTPEAGAEGSESTQPPAMASANPSGEFGRLNPGAGGYRLAETPLGALNFSAWTYVRYLNQNDLNDSYTDSFGREFDIDIRNDFQVNKVNLTFNGWVYDPDFRWLL